MDKNTILAILISIVILVGWQAFFTPTPPDVLVPAADNSAEKKEAAESVSSPAPVSAAVSSNEVSSLGEAVSIKTEKQEIFFDKSTGDIRRASVFGWQDIEGEEITFNKGGDSNYMRISSPIASAYAMDISETAEGKRVTFTAQNDNMTVIKEYIIPYNSYLIKASLQVINGSSSALNIPLQVKIGPGLGSGFEENRIVFEGALIGNAKDKKQIDADSKKEAVLTNPLWAGYTSKYFVFAAADSDFVKGSIVPEAKGTVAIAEKSFTVNANDKGASSFNIYIGPKTYTELRSIGYNLQDTIDFGWFPFFIKPILLLMIFFYNNIISNYGAAIILLTIVIKIITLPLTLKGMKSMRAMSKIQPEAMALREKYKGDPQKLNSATMELYKKHGVNPLSGCFPLLIQIPIFFALYKALLLAIELKGAPFIGYLTDLSAKDPYYITPIIMGLTMFIQQKMTPSTADPMQRKIFLAMPVIFTIMFINFQSGLVLYWLTNNILSIVQQYVVNKRYA